MNDISRTPPEGPQLRTLLLTDLVDSTGLVERLGDSPAADLFREHDRLVLKLQQEWRGRLIDRSDGLLLLFERPIDGLGFALDYTRGLRDLGQVRGHDLQARAGLHVGEVLTWKNSEAAVQVGAKPLEVEGLAKPMAARLMTLARPGQILVSAVAESLTRRAARELGERGENLLWKSHGRWRFKGVPEALEIHEVGEVGIAPLRAPSSIPKAWRDIPLWRRPAALAAEVVLIACLGVGAWFVTRPQPAIAFAERDWVVVGDLRNLTGEQVLDDSLAQAFRISLEQSRYVNVLSDMKARDTLARMQRKPGTLLDRDVASEIALRDGVRAVILPTVSEVGGKVRVSAEVVDPHTQTTVYAESADGSGAGSALDSIDKVTAALRGKLGEAIASIRKDSAPLPQVTTSNLDALRAYALGQASFGQSRYNEAKSFYERAAALDDGFALAYLGLLRSHNATLDVQGGLTYLQKAQANRAKLPSRDQLYLDAWTAEINDPGSALERWRQMAALYPDFFQASANTGYRLLARNRYGEGLPYAKRATSSRYELAALSWDLVGRLSLAQEDYPGAEKAFQTALSSGARTSVVRLSNTYAAQRRFDAAGKTRSGAGEIGPDYFDHITQDLDQGQWMTAHGKAVALEGLLQADSIRARAALYPLAVTEWMRGDAKESLKVLENMTRRTLQAIEQNPNGADASDDAFAALAAGMLAQRIGDRRIAGAAVSGLERHPALLHTVPLGAMLAIVKANDALLANAPATALELIEPVINGSEPFQAHVTAMEAHAAMGNIAKALAEARWLTRARGRAYSEPGCAWCQQPLNVLETTLAQLRAAELHAGLGQEELARKELKLFDNRWESAKLPAYFRVRRDAVLATFK